MSQRAHELASACIRRRGRTGARPRAQDVYLLDHFPVLKATMAKMGEGCPNVVSTLAGDFLAPSLLSSIDQGRGMVDVMNETPIDVICFGNHEADVPYSSLVSRINEYNGVWVNSNMPSLNPTDVPEIKAGALPDHHILRLAGGRTVALVGLLCGGGKDASLYRDDAFGGHAKRITPVLEAAPGAVERARAACPDGLDCVVPLTHQLMADDIALCGLGLPFPVVLGGHEHEVYDEVHNGTRIIKAGADAFNLAVVDLVWAAGAPANAMPTSVSIELVPLAVPKKYSGPPLQIAEPDAKLARLVAHWQAPAIELQQAVLGVYPPGALSSVDVRVKPSTMATAIATAFRQTERTDGAVINAGGVRANKLYQDGLVSFADLNKECPFPSENITILVSGDVLSRAVQISRAPWPESSGTALHCDDAMEIDPATHAVTAVAGAPLEPDRLYTVVVDSYIVKSNEALAAYAGEFPERIPPDDAGRPALPILVQYFCDRVWNKLLDFDEDGSVSAEEVEALFVEADTSGDGQISPEEMLAVIEKRLGSVQASGILAKQCLTSIDKDNDGFVSRAELLDFIKSEAESRK